MRRRRYIWMAPKRGRGFGSGWKMEKSWNKLICSGNSYPTSLTALSTHFGALFSGSVLPGLKRNLNASVENNILENRVLPAFCQQFVSLSCFNVTMPLYTKQLHKEMFFLVCSLHRSLTSTSSNTSGMSWTVSQTWSPTSPLDLTDALVSEFDQIPAAGSKIWKKDWNQESGGC